jgi:hypothetical protein
MSLLYSANVPANLPPLPEPSLPCQSALLSCATLPARPTLDSPRRPRNRQVGGSSPPSGSRSEALCFAFGQRVGQR